jgi:uncharacterized protein with PQ loop repeat
MNALNNAFWTSKEVVGFGWNGMTYTFLATLFFSFIQGWALIKQAERIFTDPRRDAASVSAPMMSFLLFHFIAFGIYGYYGKSLAIMINSLLFLLHVPVLVGIFRFKRLTKLELIFSIIPVVVPFIMMFASRRDVVFFASFIVAIIFIAMQPFEIWLKKDAGSVESKTYVAFLPGTVFWLLYAISIGDWVIVTLNPVIIVLFVATVFLCRKYRKQKPVGNPISL